MPCYYYVRQLADFVTEGGQLSFYQHLVPDGTIRQTSSAGWRISRTLAGKMFVESRIQKSLKYRRDEMFFNRSTVKVFVI